MESTDLNEIFLDENYSILSLLSRTNDLNKLRDLLLEHKQNLNQNLLELFNNSYDKFYKLSYSITHISEPIQHLLDPTQNFRDNLGELCKVHDLYIDEINIKLASLENANKNKEFAKQLVQLIKRRTRIEMQMDNIDWSIRRPSSLDLLERINIELFYLTSEIRSLQPTHEELVTIKKSLETSLERRLSQIDNWFDQAFLSAIDSQDKVMIEYVLRTYQQRGCRSRSIIYFNHVFSQIATSVESSLNKEPLDEIPLDYPTSTKFRLKICMHIYDLVTKCWSDELYIDMLELSFSQLACRIINRFADWLSKLRLSDFRKTGPATPETNFLAKQDAIMRLLIEDCDRLVNSIKEFLSSSDNKDSNLVSVKNELFSESFITLNNGLGNVRSLQRLIEK